MKLFETTSNENKSGIASPPESQSRRILVVDDDEALRQLMVSTLTPYGYEVDEAENGVRAWKVLHLKSYDLLITDHNMPLMTGLELIQKLRSAGSELPVALASGNLPSDLLERHPGLRLAELLPKPFTFEELTQTVTNLLSQAAVRAKRVSEAFMSPTPGWQALTANNYPAPNHLTSASAFP